MSDESCKNISLTVDELEEFSRFIISAEQVLLKTTYGPSSEQFSIDLRHLIDGWFEQKSQAGG